MNQYPTDEELELFIKQMEQQELYAPKHIKEQVLNQAFPKQTAGVLPKSGKNPSPVSFLAYRLKIIAGMAAAIFMLFMIPSFKMGRGQEAVEWPKEMEEMQAEKRNGMNINSVLNTSARQVNQKLNDWLTGMGSLQIRNLFGMEDGGNLYED